MRSARQSAWMALPAFALAVACVEAADPAATASAAGARQCFRPAQVNDFDLGDDGAVYLRVGAGDLYRAELFGPCPDIDWSQRIAIRSATGSSWVCRGLDAELIVPGPLGVDRCPLRNISRLTDAEARAWRERN